MVAMATKVDEEELLQAKVQDLPSHVQEPCRSCSMGPLKTEASWKRPLTMEYFASCFLRILLVQVACLGELVREEDPEEENDHQSPATCPGGQASGRQRHRPR